jgi:hypothetical protein
MIGTTREELAGQVDEAEWGWLRAHLERGGLIVVAPELELAEVAVAMAADDAATVARLVQAGRLAKPSGAQIVAWDAEPGKKFLMLIVSPYVLIQDLPTLIH